MSAAPGFLPSSTRLRDARFGLSLNLETYTAWHVLDYAARGIAPMRRTLRAVSLAHGWQ